MSKRRLATIAVHTDPVEAGAEPLAPHLTLASVYTFPHLDALLEASQGKRDQGFYRRYGHPNARMLETCVRDLEGAEDALACGSGMSTALALFWTTLQRGDHLVAAHDIYGGTYAFLQKEFVKLGIEVTFCDSDPAAVEAAMRPSTRAVFFETLTNPLMRAPEIPKIVEIAHRRGALAMVDNTFATPVHCRPLEWGVDVVYHSGTKFLGGHGDAVSGVLAGRAELVKRARKFAIGIGAVVSPLDAWLTLRGVRTLGVRVERASSNADALARRLAKHPKVARVHRAKPRKWLASGGPMWSFDVGSLRAADRFIRSCRLVQLAPSLGDVSTTTSHPARSSHAYLSPAERRKVGVTDGLLRVSTGIEDVADLLEDFEQALKKV